MSAGTTSSRVLSSSAWNLASLLVPQFYLVAVSVIVARYLGPTDTGRQSFIAFVELSLTLLLAGGLPYALVRFTGEAIGAGEPGRIRWLIRWAWRIEAAAALAGGGAMAAAGALGASPGAAWVLAGAFCAVAIMQSVPAAVLAGMQRFRVLSLTSLVTGGLTVGAIFVVLARGGGIASIFAVEVVTATANLAVVTISVRGRIAALPVAPVDVTALRPRVGRFASIATVNVLIDLVIWRRSEFFFLKHYATSEEIAFYSIAFAGVTAITQVPEAIAAALSPAFATLFGAGEDSRVRTGYARSLRLLLLVGFPLTALAVVLGPRAIEVVYGSAHSDAGRLLVIMVATLPVLSLYALNRGLLNALGRQRQLLAASAGAAVVSISLDFALIPAHGAVGAAVANAIAQLCATLPVVVYSVRHLRPLTIHPGRLLRGAAAAAVLALAAWGVTRAVAGLPSLVLGTAAGIAAYGLAGLALRPLAREDADWLSAALGEQVGRPLGRAVGLLGARA